MDTWRVEVYCPHNRRMRVDIDDGFIILPFACCSPPSPPTDVMVPQKKRFHILRIWWESRKMRKKLSKWKGELPQGDAQ